MTAISITSYLPQRYTGLNRASSGGELPEGAGQAAAQPGTAQSDKLAKLQADLEALKSRQARMSPGEYLVASFTLQEQIATERLNAGEDLDRIRIQFEGRIFNLAGKRLDLSDLKATKVSGIEMVRPVQPEDLQNPAALHDYLARR